MKLDKRNLLRPADLPHEGKTMVVVTLRKSEGDFADFDLVLKDGAKEWVVLLQKLSFNSNSLIDVLGDESDKWPGKKLVVFPAQWKDIDVLRFRAVSSA